MSARGEHLRYRGRLVSMPVEKSARGSPFDSPRLHSGRSGQVLARDGKRGPRGGTPWFE
jgi:hypothetical protein